MTQDSLKRIAQAAKISTTGVEAMAPALDGETWGDAADRGNKQLPKETLGSPQRDVMDRFTCSESRWRWQAGSEIRRRALNFFFPCGSLPLQKLACCIEVSGLMGTLVRESISLLSRRA
jgi:hypothetical protein